MARLIAFGKQLWAVWVEVKPDRMAAALAFFGMFALVPLLYVALTVAGLFLNNAVVVQQLLEQIQKVMGSDATAYIQTLLLITAKQQQSGSLLAVVVGLLILLFIASGLFTNLEDMLNTIWRNPFPMEQGIVAVIRNQFLAFVLVLAVGMIFVGLSVTSFLLSLLGTLIDLQGVVTTANWIISFVLTTAAFALLYRVLARVKPSWRAIWIGAFGAAVLLIIGEWAFSLYLQLSNLTSAYAAASALAVLLLGIYYVALIFLVGAILIRVVPSLWQKADLTATPESG